MNDKKIKTPPEMFEASFRLGYKAGVSNLAEQLLATLLKADTLGMPDVIDLESLGDMIKLYNDRLIEYSDDDDIADIGKGFEKWLRVAFMIFKAKG